MIISSNINFPTKWYNFLIYDFKSHEYHMLLIYSFVAGYSGLFHKLIIK